MTKRKKSSKKEATKQDIKLVKLSKLSKAELAKINLDDLWIMKPELKKAKKTSSTSAILRVSQCLSSLKCGKTI